MKTTTPVSASSPSSALLRRAIRGGWFAAAAAVALSQFSCAVNTTLETYPRPFQVVIDSKSYGDSPAAATLGNRTFGEYTVTLLDSRGKEVFRDYLPLDFLVWGIFWPPFGIFYNMFGAAPRYEIDVSAVYPVDGIAVSKPSAERDQPLRRSANAAVDIWTEMGFGYLDRGWLLQAADLFKVGLQVDPDYPDAILGMAIYCRQKGATAEAESWLEQYRAACKK